MKLGYRGGVWKTFEGYGEESEDLFPYNCFVNHDCIVMSDVTNEVSIER